MKSKTRRKRVPVDLQRDLVEVALFHLQFDGTWEGKDLGGETHDLSEPARRFVIELLEQLLAGKRPHLPKSPLKLRVSADERYVSLIYKALHSGATTIEDAYCRAAGAGRSPPNSTHDARILEAKRAWKNYWKERSAKFGEGHRVQVVLPAEMRDWMMQVQPTVSKKTSRGK